jgi:branched-chain amino acid transport system permease protein
MQLLQVLFTGMSAGATIALIALGLTLVFGVLRVVNFAHGALFMLGAYLCYWCTETAGIGYFPSLVICAVVIAALSVALALGVFRRFRGLELEGAIAAVALAVAIENAAILLFKAVPRQVNGPFDQVIDLGSLHLPVHRIFIIVLTAALFLALHVFVARTHWGRALRAVQQDEQAAHLQGISTTRAMVVAFAISGALGGIAGAVVAPEQILLPSMGTTPLLLAFVAIVLGGMGNVTGTLIAALLVGVLQSFVATYWVPEAATWTSFAVVLLILAFRTRRAELVHA